MAKEHYDPLAFTARSEAHAYQMTRRAIKLMVKSLHRRKREGDAWMVANLLAIKPNVPVKTFNSGMSSNWQGWHYSRKFIIQKDGTTQIKKPECS